MPEYTDKKYFFYYILIAILQFIGPISTDSYIASQIIIEDYYQIARGHGAFVLSSYYISFGLSYFFIGMINDSIGRKPILSMGAILYGIAAILAIFAPIFAVFIGARIIQGVAAACVLNATSAMIRDIFPTKTMAKSLNIIGALSCIAPIILPFFATILLTKFNLAGINYLLIFYTGAILIIIFIMPNHASPRLETHERKLSAHLNAIFKMLNNKKFLVILAISLMGPVAIPAYLSSAGYIILELNQLPLSEFAIYFTFGPLVYTIASAINAYYNRHEAKEFSINFGIYCGIFGAVSWIILYFFPQESAVLSLIPAWIIIIGHGFMTNNVVAMLINPHPNRAGTIFSVIGLIHSIVGFGASVLVGYFIVRFNYCILGAISLLFAILAKLSLNYAQKNGYLS